METFRRFGRWVNNHRVAVAAAVSTGAVFGVPAFAGADAVDSGFVTAQTSILQYVGDGVVVVIAVMGLGLGIRLLTKLAHRAVRSV